MRSALCLFIALIILPRVVAQQAASVDSRVSDALARMKNGDLSTRETAFDDMMSLISDDDQAGVSGRPDVLTSFFTRHPDEAERVKLGLIQLLNVEDETFIKGKPGTLSEEDGEYYAGVVETVSSLDDDRSIPALVGAMTTGGMAHRGLLKYGNRALGPVLEQLKNPNPLVRSVALSIGIHILRKGNDTASYAQIDGIIRSSLKDPDLVVRGSAVQEVECLNNREEFVPILEQLAKTDAAKLPGKALDGGDGEEFYPVRYDARRVLRDIRNSKTCAP